MTNPTPLLSAAELAAIAERDRTAWPMNFYSESWADRHALLASHAALTATLAEAEERHIEDVASVSKLLDIDNDLRTQLAAAKATIGAMNVQRADMISDLNDSAELRRSLAAQLAASGARAQILRETLTDIADAGQAPLRHCADWFERRDLHLYSKSTPAQKL